MQLEAQTRRMKNIGIILAGGSGTRLGAEIPKQFLKIAGKRVIEHTIEVFQRHHNIDEIAIVCNADYIHIVEESIINFQFDKVKKILSGGTERYHSTLAAIKAYDDGEEKKMIFHDAVRPLLDKRIINDCISQLDTYNAIDVAIPATDTTITVDLEKSTIATIPERKYIYKGQTPQAFKLSTIKAAYELAMQDKDLKVTDDCGVVKSYLPNEDIYIVAGDDYNMKLTHTEDIFLLDKLFQLRSITYEKDNLNKLEVKALQEKVIVVLGGSYGIGKEIFDICNQQGITAYAFSRTQTNTDVTNKEQVQKALKRVFDNEGRIDCVINTAGILHKEPLINMSYPDISNSINTNYLGSVIVAKEAFAYLKETRGSLLLYTSSSYTRGRAMYSLYSSLKAATVNFVQALSSEWDIFNVKINCINPERTKTPMRTRNFGNEPEESLLSAHQVALSSLRTLINNVSGQVIDVRKEDN